MTDRVAFETVLEVLELEGWSLVRIFQPYRIFIKRDHLPIWVKVKNRTVDANDWERIKDIIRADEANEDDEE